MTVMFRILLLLFAGVLLSSGELFEGDIMLTPEQREMVGTGSTEAYAGALKTSYWPNPLPYEIDQSLVKERKILKSINSAIEELENRTCLQFKRRTKEKAYLNFTAAGKCFSPTGYVSAYPLQLSLSTKCRTKGWVLHYIMLTLGFMHESNRPDRDAFVKVVWDNIALANRKHFKRRDAYSSNARYFNIPYDYDSITHPSRYWMGNYSVTLITKDYYKRYRIGQRKNLSQLDALSVNLMYKCPGTTKPPSTIPPDPTDAPQPELKPYLQTKHICGFLKDDIKCPFGYVMWIEDAMYGRQNDQVCSYGRTTDTNCSAPGVFQKVSDKCHDKMECRLFAYNREFGEPCKGTFKYLEVKYRCVKKDIMCGTSGKTISCPEGQVLKILNAMYGRQSKYTCPTIYAKNFNCKAVKSFEITKALCNGKQSCKIQSARNIYGDPCLGTIKYLQVHHQCVLPDEV
ncbi:nematocyst expressed protein 6-like [Hydractinia symbiolongicarpus]|uniref:nematocyst expressed protein 6-like n=1 Tax=Hydractinia symbiolongicarpus TaxID=13093 RepID=UPI0025507BD4|nr:nematocyst expressed protein 6-like [Hydractinia symbiolongicarpus]